MRILYLGNNWLGYQILKWLKEQEEEVVGLVVHPKGKGKYRDEIIKCSALGQDAIFDGSQLNQDKVSRAIKNLQPAIGISVMFGYILRPQFLAIFPKGVINLHPAYLPYNRGAYPNVWSIVDGTPAGVTIHYIDAGVDTGDIILSCEVPIEAVDTGESLYHKLENALTRLFVEAWPLIKSGKAPRIAQENKMATHHNVSDVERIDRIDLNRNYKAQDLINIIRARTFFPHKGGYFELENGRRVFLRLQLFYEEEIDQ